jgi:mRNA-degrading endonuclease toxin of MazEF toxin-antitoxin module
MTGYELHPDALADLGGYRTQEETGRRPVILWQSDTLTRLLQSVLVVALVFQMRAIPKTS